MIKHILFLAAFLTALPAWSALTEPDQATLINTKNYATNGGAENGLAGWTVSGTSAVSGDLVRDTTNKYEGNAGFAWTPHNANNHLTNTSVTITSNQGLSGANCAALVWTKTTSTTKTLEAYDGTNILASVTVPSSTAFIPVSVNWICSSSGTNTVRFGAGDTTVIYFDSLKWGDARGINITQVSQAQFFGSVKVTGCGSQWSASSTTWTNFGAQSGCTYTTAGNALAPSTNVPGIKFASMPPGVYKYFVNGTVQSNGTNAGAGWRLNDGTTASDVISNPMLLNVTNANLYSFGPLNASFTYTTAQSNVTTQVQVDTTDYNGGTQTLYGVTANPLVIEVYYFPTQSQTGYRPDQTPASWSGYHNGISGGCATTSATFADPSACTSIALNQTTARNLTCSTAGSSLPGITCTLPKGGNYKVSAKAMVKTASSSTNISMRLVDGSGTVIDPGTEITTANTFTQSLAVEGVYLSSAAGSATFKLQLATSGGISGSILLGDVTGSPAIQWVVEDMDASSAAPYITQTVGSNTSGQERVERATVILNQGSSSVSSQSGSWISFGSYSAPNTTFNFTAGEFSAAPSCTCTVGYPSGGRYFCNYKAKSSSSIQISALDSTGSEAFASNFYIDLICMGPR